MAVMETESLFTGGIKEAGNILRFLAGGDSSAFLLLNAIGDGILALDQTGKLAYANQAARNILGYTNTELVGRTLDILVSMETTTSSIMEGVYQGDIITTDESKFLHKNGAPIHVIITAIPVQHGNSVEGALIVFRDITPSVLLNRSLLEREELLRGIFNIIPSGIMLHSSTGRIARINQAAVRLLGLDEADYRGREFPEDRWDVSDVRGRKVPFSDAPFHLVLRTGRPVYDRILFLNQDGDGRYLLVSSSPLVTMSGRPDMVLTTFADIDRQFRTQKKLEMALKLNIQSNQLLTALLRETGPDETLTTALRGVLSVVPADMISLAIYYPVEAILRHEHTIGFSQPVEGMEVPLQKSPAAQMFREKRPLRIDNYPEHELVLPAFLENGATTYLGAPIISEEMLAGVVILLRKENLPFSEDDADNLNSLCAVLSAALVKTRYERRMEQMATRDSLTGLWNRRVFFENMEREIERASRYGNDLSIIMVDLDYFKKINDTHGHLAGDEVLKTVAAVMESTGRATDIVASTGGEEFMILLPDTDLQGAVKKGTALKNSIQEAQSKFANTSLAVTCSMGIGSFRAGETLEEFYARIDRLLYESKNSGRNCITAEAM